MSDSVLMRSPYPDRMPFVDSSKSSLADSRKYWGQLTMIIDYRITQETGNKGSHKKTTPEYLK